MTAEIRNIERKSNGWYVGKETGADGITVNIWCASADDKSNGERFDYHGDCTFCWLGQGHTADAHRRNLTRGGSYVGAGTCKNCGHTITNIDGRLVSIRTGIASCLGKSGHHERQ